MFRLGFVPWGQLLPAEISLKTQTCLYRQTDEKGDFMKLIFAIINNDDSHSVQQALTKSGFQTTKLSSTGGFLMTGNTTFMVCADDEKVDEAIDVIKEHSHKRKQFVPNSSAYINSSFTGIPVEVTVGGATVFVTNIEKFEKV